MTILVTGGAGYIGSHTVSELTAYGESVVVVDHLGQGHRDAVQSVPLYAIDIRDKDRMVDVLRRHDVDTVVHFAANSLVGESVQDPLKYYGNNVAATQQLLSAMLEAGVKKMVFSSTAAVYGEPKRTSIDEHDATVPTNPYGETKLAIERMLHWCHEAYRLRSICLRYFNAAGAHPQLDIGEDHSPETHLIPIILQVALGQRTHVSIYGDDYPTPDGTCIRDYIHVMDLASAHRLAVNHLRNHDVAEAFNLGNGRGFSVREVIDVARGVTGHPIPAEVAPRRAGDPAVLVASSARAAQVLGWQQQYANLNDIVRTAWQWHERHPNGYGER